LVTNTTFNEGIEKKELWTIWWILGCIAVGTAGIVLLLASGVAFLFSKLKPKANSN
jgi:hypothetical protein